jgi:hypothetical protein
LSSTLQSKGACGVCACVCVCVDAGVGTAQCSATGGPRLPAPDAWYHRRRRQQTTGSHALDLSLLAQVGALQLLAEQPNSLVCQCPA